MQDRVLDATDVLVDGHPCVRRWTGKRLFLVARVEVAQEVPGRIDERVHRVGLATGRAGAGRALGLDPIGDGRQRALAFRCVVISVRQLHRQLVFGDGHRPAAIAIDDWDGSTPVALPRHEPVA